MVYITPEKIITHSVLSPENSQQEAMMLETSTFNYPHFHTFNIFAGQYYPPTTFSKRQHHLDLVTRTRQLAESSHSEDGERSTKDICYADDLIFLVPLVGGLQRVMDMVGSLCFMLGLELSG